MKVTIVGAGAIGGLMGTGMLKSGVDVTYVDVDRDRVDGINKKGLTVHTPGGDYHVQAKAILPSQLRGPLEMVYLATKSQHTLAAMDSIIPHLGPNSTVISLQNGFNEEVIAKLIGAKRTIGAFVNYSGASLDPGEMETAGNGYLYIGELDGSITPRIKLIQSQCFNYCPTFITTNIWGYLWSKEINALSIIYTGLADVTMGEAWATDENIRVGAALMGEGLDVADVVGVTLENYSAFDPLMYRPKTKEETAALIAAWKANNRRTADAAALRPPTTNYKFQKKATGIWWDLVYRKRKSEADWLAGPVIERGEAFGVDVSLCKAMLKMINEIEEGKRRLSAENFTEMYRTMKDLGKDLP